MIDTCCDKIASSVMCEKNTYRRCVERNEHDKRIYGETGYRRRRKETLVSEPPPTWKGRRRATYASAGRIPSRTATQRSFGRRFWFHNATVIAFTPVVNSDVLYTVKTIVRAKLRVERALSKELSAIPYPGWGTEWIDYFDGIDHFVMTKTTTTFLRIRLRYAFVKFQFDLAGS